MNDQALQTTSPNSPAVNGVPSRLLTPKNRLFIQLIASGVKTIEAYKQSGYKGNNHAAYTLRTYLKDEITAQLTSQGIDKTGTLIDVQELLTLPLNVSVVTVDQKIKLLALRAKLLQADKSSEPVKTITAFVINNSPTLSSNNPSITQQSSKVVDSHIIETDS